MIRPSHPRPLLIKKTKTLKTLIKLGFFSVFSFLSFLHSPQAFTPTPFIPLTQAATNSPTPFSDLPSDPMYKSYIETFQEQNIIIGDTMGGQPIGSLRPKDPIQRDEFTKVAVLVRLLESQSSSGYQDLDLATFTLKINTLLRPYYKPINGAVGFSDVLQKLDTCASEPSGCHPWHTEYINYASSKGMIKGYSDSTFRPSQTMARIHSLKLIVAEDGNVPATKDNKFISLSNDSRIKNVKSSKCLEGAESYIIENNGGQNFDSINLLYYALLADKLDFFGNNCQFFDENNASTPKQRADLLQKPLTRQEIARYFSLTTSYSPLTADHSNNPTTDLASEYIAPITKEDDVKEEVDPLDRLGLIDSESEIAKVVNQEALRELETVYIGKSKAEMTIKELAAISKSGRCCRSKDLYPEGNCKIITFKSYSISEEDDFNWLTYDGPTWHLASNSWDACWVPFPDILNGYAAPPPTTERELLRKIVQRGSEIYGNLDSYYLAGHSLEETRNYGLGGESKPNAEIIAVNEWYKARLAREQEIYQNLSKYYNAGHNIVETFEYGYSADKPAIENYWVVQWYEKKKKELEIIAARKRAAQQAAAYRQQQAAAAAQAAQPDYGIFTPFVNVFEPFSPVIQPIYDAYVAPTVNNYVDIGKDIIIYNIEESIKSQQEEKLKNDMPWIYNADYFGTHQDDQQEGDLIDSINQTVNNITSGEWAGDGIRETMDNIENMPRGNDIFSKALDVFDGIQDLSGAVADGARELTYAIGDGLRATHKLSVDSAEAVGGFAKDVTTSFDQFVMEQFNKTPEWLIPATQRTRDAYNLSKGVVRGGAGAVEGIFQIYKDPVGVAEGLNYAVNNLDIVLPAVGKSIDKFVDESFSSRDKFFENTGVLGFEVGSIFFGGTLVKNVNTVTKLSKAVTTADKISDAVRVIDRVSDITTAAKALDKVADTTKVSKVLGGIQDSEKVAAIISKMKHGKAAEILSKMGKSEAGAILNRMDDVSLSKFATESQLARKIILHRKAADELAVVLKRNKANIGDPVEGIGLVLNEIEKKFAGSYIREFKFVKNSIENIPGMTGKVDPHSLRFSQSTLSNIFSGKKAKTVESLIVELKAGGSKVADNINPIRIVKVGDEWFSIDNRRLFAFKEANVPVRYEVIDLADNMIRRNAEGHLDTFTNGAVIIVKNKL